MEYIFVFPPTNNIDLSAPIGIYLEISERCNMECRHCYKPTPKKVKALGTRVKKLLLNELACVGVLEIRLCGNEPTASPDFFEICQFIKDLGLYLGVNTNAYFDYTMSRKIIELNPNFVAVSVDGNETTHDSIRRTGSYKKAVNFLETLSSTTIKRRINTVLSQLTIDKIGYTVQLANDLGTDVSFLPFRPIGRESSMKMDKYLTKESMYKAVSEITELREKYPNVRLLTYFDIIDQKVIHHHSMDFNSPCPARKNGFISYYGDFFPCDFLRYLGDRFLCGNVYENGFWRIWAESRVLKSFQAIEHQKCKECNFYMKKCYGGCVCGSKTSLDNIEDELCFINLL